MTGAKNVSRLLLLLVLMLSQGCAFTQLERDLEALRSAHEISGRIVSQSPHQKPVVVVLWALDEGEQSSYWVVPHGGEFSFFRTSGRYYLMAFEDADEDATYDDDFEYTGLYGSPRVIDLSRRGTYTGIELVLRRPGKVSLPVAVQSQRERSAEARFAQRMAQTGELTSLDNPLFCDEKGTMGLWTPVAFLKEIGVRIYFLEEYDPRKTPVLFVHGSNGHPGTWREMVQSLNSDRYQAWVAFYPSGMRLDLLGEVLAKHLEELRLRHGFDELVVAAHSMGGLVSRSMLLDFAEMAPDCSIPQFITLATPWGGHSGAKTGVERAPTVIPQWYDMVPQSDFLRQLFERDLPDETVHTLFFAHHGTGGIGFSAENSDGAVTLASQLRWEAQLAAGRVIGVDATHVEILSHTNTLAGVSRILNGAR